MSHMVSVLLNISIRKCFLFLNPFNHINLPLILTNSQDEAPASPQTAEGPFRKWVYCIRRALPDPPALSLILVGRGEEEHLKEAKKIRIELMTDDICRYSWKGDTKGLNGDSQAGEGPDRSGATAEDIVLSAKKCTN